MNTAQWITISVPAVEVAFYRLAARVQNHDPDEDTDQNTIDAAKATVEKFHADWEAAAIKIKELFSQVTRVQFWEDAHEYGAFGEVDDSGSFSLFDCNFIH